MKTIFLNNTPWEPTPCVATIGMFDGVHLGHRFVIDCLKEEAGRRNLPSCVVTFERPPRQVIQPEWKPQLLSTLDEKLVLLSLTGIDLCVVLPFSKDMAQLNAHAFMQQVLKEQLGVQVLLTGYDNHFGHRTAETREGFEDYRRYGETLGMEVKCLREFKNLKIKELNNYINNNTKLSSSCVRQLLKEGRIEEANECLGYPYSISGTVRSGDHIGTHLGFPTANLQPDDDSKLIPANGVYAVKVRLSDSLEQKHGMANIGSRPTFNGKETTIEAHILRHFGPLYDQRLTILFINRLRDERRFESPEALAEQLSHDAEMTEERLTIKN